MASRLVDQPQVEPRPWVVRVVGERLLEEPLGFADFAVGEQTLSAQHIGARRGTTDHFDRLRWGRRALGGAAPGQKRD